MGGFLSGVEASRTEPTKKVNPAGKFKVGWEWSLKDEFVQGRSENGKKKFGAYQQRRPGKVSPSRKRSDRPLG